MKDKIIEIAKEVLYIEPDFDIEEATIQGWEEFATRLTELIEPESQVSEEYIRDKIGIIVDSTRFHDVRIEWILQQKEALTEELVKAFKELI